MNLNVSGKPSEGQRINCWIRAPPRGGSGHVTLWANGVYRAESRRGVLHPVVLEIGRLPIIIVLYCFYICAYITLHLIHPSRGFTLDAPDI